MKTKADILTSLQRDILSLQGLRTSPAYITEDAGLGRINQAFPNAVFPLKAVHEFCCHNAEEAAASGGFIAGLLSAVLQKKQSCLWIFGREPIFPPALTAFGIRPDKIIFLKSGNEKHALWALEEALKCTSLGAVVGTVQDLDFTQSRRLQLLVEKSGVPCFVLRRNPRNLTTAAVTRWHIKPLPSYVDNGLPGVGHPCWQVALLKVRNGRPGIWELEWRKGHFRHPAQLTAIDGGALQKKAV